MKKLLSVILALILAFCVLPVSSFAADSVKSIAISRNPTKMTYYENADGRTEIYYEDVYQNGRYVRTDEKEFFRYGIDFTGMKIKVTYTSGTVKEYSEYNIDFEYTAQEDGETWGIGSHSVTVSYKGRTASFNISIVDNPVESISLVSLPDKTTYFVGVDGYDTRYVKDIYDSTGFYVETIERDYFLYEIQEDGLDFMINFKNGDSVLYSRRTTLNDEIYELIYQEEGETWNAGVHEVVLYYMGFEISFNVTVAENLVKSVSVYKTPGKTKYSETVDGETLTDFDGRSYTYYDIDFTGAKLKVTYKTNETEIIDISDAYLVDGLRYYDNQVFEHYTAGTNTVNLNYMGFDVSFDITVVANTNPVLGDVDGNGKINSSDALAVLRFTVGEIDFSDYQKACADVTKDTRINSVDALNILQYAVGTIVSF